MSSRRASSAIRNLPRLALPRERQIFTEHLDYRVSADAAALIKSWSNRQAIEDLLAGPRRLPRKDDGFGEFLWS